MNILRMAAVAVGCTAAIFGSTAARASTRCQPIEATIYDGIVSEGRPPPTQVCVVGVVRGGHGFNGTNVFIFGSC